MLGLITWGQYWELVLVALVLYYGFLIRRFYRGSGLRRSVARGRMDGPAVRQGVLVPEAGGEEGVSSQWEAMNVLVAQLRILIGEAKVAGVRKDELMGWIQGLLFTCRHLRATREGEAVNEYLKRMCLQEFALELTEEDLDWLWRGKEEKGVSGVVQTSIFMVVLVAGLVRSAVAQTADGNAGLTQANTLIRGYYATAVQLMYAIGGIVGLAGAVHVYMKWSRGDHDTQRVAIAWMGACIFLVVVATVIQSFFGL